MKEMNSAYKVSDDFNIFVISDGTGKTATSMVQAALLQFDLPRVNIVRFARIRSREEIYNILDMVQPKKDIIAYTVVNEELAQALRVESLNRGILALDLLGPVVEALKKVSSRQPRGVPGLLRRQEEGLSPKIEALEHAWKESSGFSVSNLEEADVVILGVWYPRREEGILMLAERGIRAAFLILDPALPLFPNLEETVAYSVDKPVIGLQMDVDYLTRVREERVRALGLDRLLYKAEKEVVKEELDFAQRVYDKLGCQVIDVTGLSSRDLVNAIMSQIKKKREEMR